MKSGILVNLFVLGFMLAALPCQAVEFAPIGSEAMSMGGAGVASSRGAYAPYYNPALLAESKNKVEIGFAVGVAIREQNLAEHIDTLSDLEIDEDFDVLSENITTPVSAKRLEQALEDIDLFRSELRQISRINGLQAMPGLNLGCQVKDFGFGIYGISDVAASAIIDPNHLDVIVEEGGQYFSYDSGTAGLVTQADYEAHSLQYALDNKLTYLNLTGLIYLEIPIAYGRRFDTPYGTLDLGGSFKIMPGYTVYKDISINTDSGDVDEDLSDNEESSTSWGVDLGVLFKPAKVENLAVGLVAKNLNTPKFDTKGACDLKVKPQVRLGTAYSFLDDKLTAAVDLDVTKNETFIPGYDAQYIGGGVNYHPKSWFSLRAGLMQNLVESDEGTILTLGFGIGPKWLQLDLGAMASTKSSEYNGSSIPSYAKVQLALNSRW
ncbi:MAG: conjugal transfer protein TraF [Syntrophaceae bacterium]